MEIFCHHDNLITVEIFSQWNDFITMTLLPWQYLTSVLWYLSCRVPQAYKKSSLRIELCLWINAIYPLLQCQSSSSSLVMHLTGTQVRTLAGSQCLFSPWRYLIVKVFYHHHWEMSSYHDNMVLPIFCQWTDCWVDFLIDMVANSLLKLSVSFQGSPTQATTAQRGIWSLRRREDSTPTSSKRRRKKGEACGDRPSPGLAGKHIHPGRPFHKNCLKHWVKFPEFAYA